MARAMQFFYATKTIWAVIVALIVGSVLMLAAGAYFLGTGAAGLVARPPDPPTQAYWWLVAAPKAWKHWPGNTWT